MNLFISPSPMESKALFSEFSKTVESIQVGGEIQISPNVTALCCGMGPFEPIFHLENFWEKKPFCHLVLFGLAGGFFSNGGKVGDLVFCEEEIFIEAGIRFSKGPLQTLEEGWGSRLDLTPPPTTFPLAKLNLEGLPKLKGEGCYQKGKSGTAWGISGDQEEALFRSKSFPTLLIENMEGAGIARWSQYRKVPFYQLRAISNRAGDRDLKNWEFNQNFLNLKNMVHFLIKKWGE